jgi:hypothetical protein
MAGKRKAPAKKAAAKKVAPELVHEDGFWWIVSGTKRLNAGRNQRYAEQLMATDFPAK